MASPGAGALPTIGWSGLGTPSDDELAMMATADGVILARQLDGDVVRRLLRGGQLVRVRRGAYRLPAVPYPHPYLRSSGPDSDAPAPVQREREVRRRLTALAAQLTTGFWFSHESAALIWDLAVVHLADEVHLTQLFPQNGQTDPLVRRHCAELPPADRQLRGGLPVTGIDRTVIDCLTSLPRPRALVVADSALRAGVRREDLERRLRARAGYRGVRTGRRVLAWADGRSESPGESLTRWVVLAAGLPAPEPQLWVQTHLGRFRVDLGWPAERVAVEFDGAVKYTDPRGGSAVDALLAEKRRHDALQEAGWLTLRVTWPDLQTPARLHSRIARALTTRNPHRPSPNS
ncbi:hypothetical protein [Cellulomonas hominis]